MKSSIFREYDIRGIVGSELLLEECHSLGLALITYLLSKHPGERRIIIGRDGRKSSPAIQNALIKAAHQLELEVIDIGIVPSPVMYFATYHLNCQLGIVITASHNPDAYNGIKIWGVWGTEIQKIRHLYEEAKDHKKSTASTTSHHDMTNNDQPVLSEKILVYDIITPYIEYLAHAFAHLKNKHFPLVLDCGHGTATVIYPKLIEKMGLQGITLLCASLDKPAGAHEADPTVRENMQDVATVLAQEKDLRLGIGLDGDCDRMTPMTKDGHLVYGDILLGIFAQDVLEKNPQAKIICDIKSSSALLEYLETLSAEYYLSPSGHSIIKEQLKKHQADLAGELSCHFFFKDRYFGYDDGIYASLRLLELLDNKQCTLEELIKSFPVKRSSPEIRITCKDDQSKKEILADTISFFAARPYLQINTIDGMRITQDYGWGLIRASNTQPALCLRFESTHEAGLAQIKHDFFTALSPHFDEATLHDYFDKNSL